VNFFPAGGIKFTPGTIVDYKTRPWYKNTLAAFALTNSPNFVISGPYIDLRSGLKILTYSMPIVKDVRLKKLKTNPSHFLKYLFYFL